MARLFERRISPLDGPKGRAAGAVLALLVFAIGLTLTYIVFYAISDFLGLTAVIVANGIATVLYVGGIVILRLGKQLQAGVLALTVATAQIVYVTSFIGWHVGLQLFLIAAAQLVFMIFTDRQVAARWLFIVIASAGFAVCQFVFDPALTPYKFPADVESVLFSVNAAALGLMMVMLAALAHVRSGVAQAQARASASHAELLANTDLLTGLANRRPVVEELARLSRAGGGRYSVAIADLDNFKALNDAFGHTCGDNVLAALGHSLGEQLRESDTIGRWGGEEFIFVLPATDLDDARAMMDRMREAIAGFDIECGRHTHRVTASFGVADAHGDSMAHRVINRADDAMYDAKDAGRNNVQVRSSADAPHSLPTLELPRFRRQQRDANS